MRGWGTRSLRCVTHTVGTEALEERTYTPFIDSRCWFRYFYVCRNFLFYLSVKAFCPCGGLYFGGDRPKHCAHKLTDVLIKRGKLSPWPENCVCCPAGRPIVASEVRDYIFTDPVPDPAPDEAYYIFCIGPGSNGHVYYGTRSRCLEG